MSLDDAISAVGDDTESQASSLDQAVSHSLAGTEPAPKPKITVDTPPPSGRKPLYDPDRPTIGQPLGDFAHEMASGAYHTIKGGLSGLVTLGATRGDTDAAKKAVEDETSQIYHAPPNRDLSGLPASYQGPQTRAAIDAMNQPGPGMGDVAGDALANAGAPPLASALVKSGLNIGQGMVVPKGVLAERAPVTPPVRVTPIMGDMASDAPAFHAGNIGPPGTDVHPDAATVTQLARARNGANVVAEQGVPQGLGPPGVTSVQDTTALAQRQADKAFAAQSQGASAKAPDVSKLTPETQAELAAGAAKGLTPNPDALQRIHDAETLPVPVRLMPGQASGDIGMQNAEFNSKAKYPEIGNRFDEQNTALKENMDEIRREAAPNAVGNNTVQNSQALIDKLKTVADARDAAITEAYNKAKAANGNKMPMDGTSFIDRVKSATADPLVSEFLPGSVKRSVIDRIEAKGAENMTLEDYLASRKILSNELRKAQMSGDGNAEHAIGVVRDHLEQTKPAPGVGAEAKALYDKATALARDNFSDLKTNPAYKAAYNDRDVSGIGEASDLNKNFVQRFIVGGGQANLRRLREIFGNDEEAHQTMTAAALNHLSESAGIDPIRKTGNFSGHGYNSAYADIAPRAQELLRDPELIDKVEQLGRTAGYTTEQKRGTAFNNSHTFVASQAETLPGKALVYGAKKIPVVGDMAADALTKKAGANARQEMLDRILKPGAGLY